jgi:hypothetical protein
VKGAAQGKIEMGRPSSASSAAGRLTNGGHTSVGFTQRNGTRNVSGWIRSGSNERQASSSPAREEVTGGDGEGWEAHWRHGEGRRRVVATLSR